MLHVYILVLEMFLWDKPAGMRAFGNTQAAATANRKILFIQAIPAAIGLALVLLA